MSSLTVEFRGVTEQILEKLVEKGYAKTKTEALRFAVIHIGQEMKLISEPLAEQSERFDQSANADIWKDLEEDKIWAKYLKREKK